MEWPYLLIFALIAMSMPMWEVSKYATSADSWLIVTDVKIHDSKVGKTPKMEVDRTIVDNFTGEWIAEVEKYNKLTKEFSVVCTGYGKNDYTTKDKLPSGNKLNLDWWTYPTKYTPTIAGSYRVKTKWVIKPLNYPKKEVRNTSNVFKVTE